MKPTLNHVFGLSLLGLVAILALLFVVVFDGSRTTIVESSENIRNIASQEISERVTRFLGEAPEIVAQFQRGLAHGLIDPPNPASIEPALSALLLSDPNVEEVTFTSGRKTGIDEKGYAQLAKAPREQWSVFRSVSAKGGEQIWSRHVHQENEAFVSDRRLLDRTANFGSLPISREPETFEDPTLHPTFVTPTREDLHGELVPSDLHWSQIDADLPPPKRRVEFSVQQVINDSGGNFLGVLRVGLLARQLDDAMRLKLSPAGGADPHTIFLCDKEGRLITRIMPDDRIEEGEYDLRVSSANLPKEIKVALANPHIRDLSAEAPAFSGHFSSGGEEYLCTFRALTGTEDWVVGIVVPRSHYLGKLADMRNRLLAVSLGIMFVTVSAGVLILRGVKRAQGQITRESLKMNAFEFSPASTDSPVRDVSDVLEGLEKAKTAMRAMSKYAPIDLVRRLYRENSEPVLGGQPMEISIMFTDIKGFTTLSEQFSANELAGALGRYLDVMARIIQQETHGTIDKYIGDAIMALWNAPEPVKDHARMACAAALKCRDAGRALAEAPEWKGLPAFETRFGLHRDTALVGHFGAPDRMNYTAIGDAVNLAARLEGLNKQYGTTIIVSERIVEAARHHFAFRLLDLVAVKGKTLAVKIYELLGENERDAVRSEAIAAYEKAFAHYLTRDFASAIDTLKLDDEDPPSAVLSERCRAYLKQPPPEDWGGIFVAQSK